MCKEQKCAQTVHFRNALETSHLYTALPEAVSKKVLPFHDHPTSMRTLKCLLDTRSSILRSSQTMFYANGAPQIITWKVLDFSLILEDQSSYPRDSQPYLHIRISWGNCEIPNAQASPLTFKLESVSALPRPL